MALDGLSDGVWLVTYAVEESVLLTQRLIVN
jgi:ABC-type taurine transport system ATPase subunit